MPHPCRRIQPLGQPSRSRDARGTTIDDAKARGLPPSDIRSLHFVPRQAHLALQGTRSALIGAGGLSNGGTGIGVGGSSIGLGSCGSGRTGGLPGGLGLPGCPPISKLRSDFALEKTPAHRLGSADRRLEHGRGSTTQTAGAEAAVAATADEPVPDGFQGLDAVYNNYRKSASVNGRPARASYTATVEANPPDVPSS